MKQIAFIFDDISAKHPRFEVRADGPVLGRVEYLWIRHLRQFGWVATAADGSHRAVHEKRWQAAWALSWDGTGYPFPVAESRRPVNEQ